MDDHLLKRELENIVGSLDVAFHVLYEMECLACSTYYFFIITTRSTVPKRYKHHTCSDQGL